MLNPFENERYLALKKLALARVGPLRGSEERALRLTASDNDDPKDWPLSSQLLPIRPSFVRWLATDEDAFKHIAPGGIRIVNSIIPDTLDLSFCKCPFPMRFTKCVFKSGILLLRAQFMLLFMNVCTIKGAVEGGGLITTGGVSFGGSEMLEKVVLQHTQCGNLSFQDASLKGHLDLEGCKVTTDVICNGRFDCAGTVFLAYTEIGGVLSFFRANLKARGLSLNAEYIKVARTVSLEKLKSAGIVSFVGADIVGDMDCDASAMEELSCRGLRLGGGFFWTHIAAPKTSKITLSGAVVAAFHDDFSSYPGKGNLHVEDFIYHNLVLHDGLSQEDVVDRPYEHTYKITAEDRLVWLTRQPDDELRKPQPWMELSGLLESQGDKDGAKEVIFHYHRQLAASEGLWRQTTSFPIDLLQKEPLWIAPFIGILGALASLVFWRAQRMHAMVPTDQEALGQFKCGDRLPHGYPPFNPVVYSMENILPVVRLGQDSAWTPDPHASYDTWLPEHPAWLRRFAFRWRITRWLSRLSYARLALVRWSLIVLGWALAGILTYAIGERFMH